MRMAVGAVYQTLTCCSCRMRYQRSASKSASSTMLVTPCSKRRDDAIRRAGHPAGIGRAPEDIVGVQIENIFAGHVVHQHRIVDVDGPLGHAGGAAGEVQQGHVLGIGRRNRELGGGSAIRLGSDQMPSFQIVLGIGQQHVLQLRQRCAQLPRRSLRYSRSVVTSTLASPRSAAAGPVPDRRPRTGGRRRWYS